MKRNRKITFEVFNLTAKTGTQRVPLDGISARVIIRTVGTVKINGMDILDVWGNNNVDNSIDFTFPVVPDGQGNPIPYNEMLIFTIPGGAIVGSVTVFRLDDDSPN